MIKSKLKSKELYLIQPITSTHKIMSKNLLPARKNLCKLYFFLLTIISHNFTIDFNSQLSAGKDR